MLRTVRKAAAATALAAAALVTTPTLAAAGAVPMGPESGGPAPVISCYGVCQFAGGDIFNAGRDNIVGSGDKGEIPGPGTPAPTIILMIVNNASALMRTNQTGNTDYPEHLFTGASSRFPAEGPSSADYTSRSGGTLHIEINARQQVNCTTDGSLSCNVRPGFEGATVTVFGG